MTEALSIDVLSLVFQYLETSELCAAREVHARWDHTFKKYLRTFVICLNHVRLNDVNLGPFRNARRISFGYTDISDESLGRLDGVENIIFHRCPKITRIGIKSLTSSNHIRYIDINQCQGIFNSSVKYLKGVRRVSLSRSNITDGCMKYLSRTHKLSLEMTNITDAGIVWLHNVRNLDIGYCRITDVGLSHLGTLNLKVLRIAGCKLITNDGIQHLSKIPNLNLSNTNITDLSPLSNVRTILLIKCNIHDSALAHIRNAQFVNLKGNPQITENGIRLVNFTTLKWINIIGCTVSSEYLMTLPNHIKMKIKI
jgi:Leucine-rich repeat (LRR) protein